MERLAGIDGSHATGLFSNGFLCVQYNLGNPEDLREPARAREMSLQIFGKRKPEAPGTKAVPVA